jgi:hypothetical protein
LLTVGEPVASAEVDRQSLLVESMSDGGTGSLRLVPTVMRSKQRFFGNRVSSYEFADEDGVRVIAALVVDTDGHIYELELFKTDFSRLKRLPPTYG